MITNRVDQKDLVILVPDNNIKAALTGVLKRNHSLNIRPITYEIYVHMHRDPGCLRESHSFLQIAINRFQYGLVVFDREGCGRDKETRDVLEKTVEENLNRYGWENRSAAIVIDPELEAWVWKKTPHVDCVLGWDGRNPSLRAWLLDNGYISDINHYPGRPKEALETALRVVRKQRTSSIYQQLAERVSLDDCRDPSFVKLRDFLRSWFATGSII